MSKSINRILTLAVIALIMIGVALGVAVVYRHHRFSQDKTLSVAGKESAATDMVVELTNVYPGQSVSYKLHLKGNEGEAFRTNVLFQKNKESSPVTIAPFIDVEIRVNGQAVAGDKLAAYLNGTPCTYDIAFDTENVDVEIIYSMALDVGDEAQNTEADFTVTLTVERK